MKKTVKKAHQVMLEEKAENRSKQNKCMKRNHCFNNRFTEIRKKRIRERRKKMWILFHYSKTNDKSPNIVLTLLLFHHWQSNALSTDRQPSLIPL